MKKIVNWTFGSVFRTFGRIIAYIIVGVIIALIVSKNHVKLPDILSFSVEAPIKMTSSSRWAKNLPSLEQTLYKDCTGSTTCSTTLGLNNYTEVFEDATERVTVRNSSEMNIAGNGILIMNNSGPLKSGYIYQVSYYLCSGSNLQPSGSSFYISSIDYSNPGVEHNTYKMLSSSAISGTPFGSQSSNFSYCRKFEGLIVPNADYNWVGIRLKSFGSSYYINTIAYEIEELGIYSENIRSIVQSVVTANNANLASSAQLQQTSEDIQQAQSETTDAVNQGLTNTCSNVVDYKTVFSSIASSYTTNTGKLVITPSGNYGSVFYKVTTKKNTIYHLSANTSDRIEFTVYDNATSGTSIMSQTSSGNFSTTFTSGNSGTTYIKLLAFGTGNITNVSNLMLSEKTSSYCEFGTSSSKLDETNQAINNVNDTLNNDDTSEASSSASNFFSSFSTNTHGLTGIITAPLNAIQSLSSKTCSPLVIPLPFVNQDLTLPCMRPIYEQHFGSFMTLYDIITLGIVSYWVMVRIFSLVKDFKNPDHDEIEVVDL